MIEQIENFGYLIGFDIYRLFKSRSQDLNLMTVEQQRHKENCKALSNISESIVVHHDKWPVVG